MAKPVLGADDRIKGKQFACKSFKSGKAGSLGQDALLTRFSPQFGDGDVYERHLKKREPAVGKPAFFSSNLGGREVSLDVRKSAVGFLSRGLITVPPPCESRLLTRRRG